MNEKLSAEAFLENLESRAAQAESPCGDGRLVWRIWGEGPPLLLLHGGAGSWRHWARQIDALAGRYRLLVPDLPGLGDSALPPPPHTPERFAALLADGLEKLAPERELRIAGFSFGSILGCHLAAIRPGVSHLAMAGCGGLGHVAGPFPRARRATPEMDPQQRREVVGENLAIFMLADPARVDALAVSIQQENLDRARFRERAIAESDSLHGVLPRLRMPLLAQWGARDPYAAPDPEERCRTVQRLAPHAATELVPSAGHWVPYEAAEAYRARLLSFLQA